MKTLYGLAGTVGFVSYLLGCLFSYSSAERASGQILTQGGAVIIAALLISWATSERHRGR